MYEDDRPIGVQEIRLRKSGSVAISVANSVRLFASRTGTCDVIFDDLTSNDLWILAEGFKNAASRRFDAESGKGDRSEVLYYKGTSEVAEK